MTVSMDITATLGIEAEAIMCLGNIDWSELLITLSESVDFQTFLIRKLSLTLASESFSGNLWHNGRTVSYLGLR